MSDFLKSVFKIAKSKGYNVPIAGMHQSGITWFDIEVEPDISDWIRENNKMDLYMVDVDRTEDPCDDYYQIDYVTISFGWLNREQSEKAILSMLKSMP